MAVCPVCGCKTDALDFVQSKIGAMDVNVCSFCHKQLNSLNGNSAGDAQLNWLTAVLGKGVPERGAEVVKELRALLEKNGASIPVEGTASEPYNPPATPVKTTVYKANSGEAKEGKDAEIAELTDRIEKLEKQLFAFKRSLLIKTICEIALPVILLIIIFIIFFSSDFYSELSFLLDSFMS